MGANNQESYDQAVENLTKVIGERYKVKRNIFVKPEDSASSKMKSLMR